MSRSRSLIVGGVLAIAAVLALSGLASGSPDGLEASAERAGIETRQVEAPFGTAVSIVVGLAVVGGAGVLLGRRARNSDPE